MTKETTMAVLRDRLVQDLTLGGYSPHTIRQYVSAVAAFVKFHRRSPDKMGHEEVRAWVQHLMDAGTHPQRMRQHIGGLKFFYGKTLARPAEVAFLSWPSTPVSLPTVLSAAEVEQVLAAFTQPKYRVLYTLLYSTGLRVSEACRLETGDIDAARGVIHVRFAKGRRERLAALDPRLLAILRAYWKQERPIPPYLFTTRTGKPLHPEQARNALRHARTKLKLDKTVTPHVMRHTFATHMLEQGTDLRVLQVLLGHASIRSTVRYARVSTKLLAKTKSPLRNLKSAG